MYIKSASKRRQSWPKTMQHTLPWTGWKKGERVKQIDCFLSPSVSGSNRSAWALVKIIWLRQLTTWIKRNYASENDQKTYFCFAGFYRSTPISHFQTKCTLWTRQSTGHKFLLNDLLLTPLYHHSHPSYLSHISYVRPRGGQHCWTGTTLHSWLKKSPKTLVHMHIDKWVWNDVLQYSRFIVLRMQHRHTF